MIKTNSLENIENNLALLLQRCDDVISLLDSLLEDEPENQGLQIQRAFYKSYSDKISGLNDSATLSVYIKNIVDHDYDKNLFMLYQAKGKKEEFRNAFQSIVDLCCAGSAPKFNNILMGMTFVELMVCAIPATILGIFVAKVAVIEGLKHFTPYGLGLVVGAALYMLVTLAASYHKLNVELSNQKVEFTVSLFYLGGFKPDLENDVNWFTHR